MRLFSLRGLFYVLTMLFPSLGDCKLVVELGEASENNNAQAQMHAKPVDPGFSLAQTMMSLVCASLCLFCLLAIDSGEQTRIVHVLWFVLLYRRHSSQDDALNYVCNLGIFLPCLPSLLHIDKNHGRILNKGNKTCRTQLCIYCASKQMRMDCVIEHDDHKSSRSSTVSHSVADSKQKGRRRACVE